MRLSRLCSPAFVVLVACAKEKTEPESPKTTGNAVVPSAVVPSATVPSATPNPTLGASASTDATPRASASASSSARTGSAAAVGPSSSAPEKKDDGPPPKVKIVTIGMHVAGGPFDEETKIPFKKAVEPHFPELAKCWRLVTSPHTADVGVDLLIEPGGGKPKVTNPRASIDGEGFKPCVVAFFEGIEFDKPKNGRTGVSYSVRFKP